jgi:hypothetical protein
VCCWGRLDLLQVGQRQRAGPSVWIASVTRPRTGFDGTGKKAIGIDVFAAHYHVQPGLAAGHSGSEVDLISV